MSRDPARAAPISEAVNNGNSPSGEEIGNGSQVFTERQPELRNVSNHANRSRANSTHANSTVPDAVLPSIFGQSSTDIALIRQVLRILNQLQAASHMAHRFHLFVESDYGEVGESEQDSHQHVGQRILFSPSLSILNRAQESGINEMFAKLTELSFRAVPSTVGDDVPGRSHNDGSPEIPRTPIHQPILRTFPAPSLFHNTNQEEGATAVRPRSSFVERIVNQRLRAPGHLVTHWPDDVRTAFEFPTWCPFPRLEYTEEPQASNERLILNENVVKEFYSLQDLQVTWIYQEFFQFLHREGRRRRTRGMAKTLTYSQFTPPWIRRQLFLNSEGSGTVPQSVYLLKVAITDLRHHRNGPGYNRIRFLLAAFFIQEPTSARPLIQHLIDIVQPEEVLSNKKRKKRSNHSVNSRIVKQRMATGPGSTPAVGPAETPRHEEGDFMHRRDGRVASVPTPRTRETVLAAQPPPSLTLTNSNPGEAERETRKNNCRDSIDASGTRDQNTQAQNESRNREPVAEDEEDFDLDNIHEDRDSDLEDPHKGPIRCGALMACHWKLQEAMQSLEKMNSNCKECHCLMHSACQWGDMLCNSCKKKKLAKTIQADRLL